MKRLMATMDRGKFNFDSSSNRVWSALHAERWAALKLRFWFASLPQTGKTQVSLSIRRVRLADDSKSDLE